MTLALVAAASFTANILIIRALGDYHAANVWLISCARFVVGLALIYAIYPANLPRATSSSGAS